MTDKNDDKDTKKTTAPATAAPVVEVAPVAKPNLTRDSLELTLAARYEAEGKGKPEAKKLAAARALEMIPE